MVFASAENYLALAVWIMMVILKVTDGQETRKFQVTSQLTFDQLREQLIRVFPSLAEEKDLRLQYRDNDGDLITLSTNEEFQQVLALIPEDGVWKLRIDTGCREHSLFDHFLQPFSWHGFDEEFKRAENLFKQRMGIGMAAPEPPKVTASEAGAERQTVSPAGLGGGQVTDGSPRWHCRTIGSWQPRTYAGRFGHETVIGPVGYHMWWGHPDNQQKHPDDQQKHPDDQQKQEPPQQ